MKKNEEEVQHHYYYVGPKTSRWHDVVWFDGALNAAVWCADEGIVVLQRCSVAALQWCSKRYTNVLRDDEDDER